MTYPQPQTYHPLSRAIHWLMAALIFIMLGLGWGREFAPHEWGRSIMSTHKAIGVLLIFLIIFRIGWRIYKKPPTYSAALSKPLKIAAHIAHGVLYLLLIVMPVSGWAMVSAKGRAASIYGILTLPPLMDKTPALETPLEDFHATCAFILAGLIALHIGAVLYHHFILKDQILRRMLPK